VIDRIAQRDVTECAVNSHIAYGCESGFQSKARVRHGFKRDLRRCLFQLRNRIGIARSIGQMCVAVDETRKHGHFREVNDGCARRHSKIFSNRLNPAAAHHDHLIAENPASIDVNKFSGANHCCLGWLRSLLRGQMGREEEEHAENKKAALKHSHPPNRV
jgi:hypothetical protein